eukprot:CAMPEP_0184729014 /NCGR_PEP_ID=MMETSP0314-20130426/42715_1 /TAXON_ID=38298 /ORGANISM="Rhodella maculata, Strain CCMP 736" /LENGTH=75 /DNA_ID=CAMNT_0027194973 /DNA_START=1365 /DNA_END=1592 /DNA_ORIENTATION=-
MNSGISHLRLKLLDDLLQLPYRGSLLKLLRLFFVIFIICGRILFLKSVFPEIKATELADNAMAVCTGILNLGSDS